MDSFNGVIDMNKCDTQVSKEKNEAAHTAILLNGKITKEVLEELYRIGSSTKVIECKNMILRKLARKAICGSRELDIVVDSEDWAHGIYDEALKSLVEDGYTIKELKSRNDWYRVSF